MLYNGTNITEDLSRYLVAFTYTDNMDEADTLDIQLEDSSLLWQNTWYPEKGAKVQAEIGLQGGEIVDCGTFEIDEIEFLGPPDMVNMRCIAAGFTSGKKRSGKSHVHEQKTLAEIIRTVASSAGLKVQGNISNVRVGRVVQRKERDLRFLRRLAKEYGYTFNVRDSVATFMPRADLEKSGAVATFQKSDLLSFSIRDKSVDTYKRASIKFHNPETGETVTHTETDSEHDGTDDEIELKTTAETNAQAVLMTRAALNAANKMQQSGNVSLPGSPVLVAGNVIELTGLGLLSGNYLIKASAHTVGIAEGWLVDLEVYKVGFVDESKR